MIETPQEGSKGSGQRKSFARWRHLVFKWSPADFKGKQIFPHIVPGVTSIHKEKSQHKKRMR
jgi:hypothetical protein